MFSYMFAMCVASTGECLQLAKQGNDYPTLAACTAALMDDARTIRLKDDIVPVLGPCMSSDAAQVISSRNSHTHKAK